MTRKASRTNDIDVQRPPGEAQEDMAPLSLRLPQSDLDRLSKAANAHRLKVGTMARMALCEWLDRAEAAA